MSNRDLQSDLMRLELMRLLEALGDEIAATSDQEIRNACAESRWPLTEAAKEVRDLIAAANGNPGKARIDPFADPAGGDFELESWQPYGDAAEGGHPHLSAATLSCVASALLGTPIPCKGKGRARNAPGWGHTGRRR
jgi:hypothetical protein